ncbi:hypothetical protein O5404_07235 (plasmid) [Borrelia miyamotoi]|uniref:Uncharacterized protein n=1 Tax=Borrelia miyamotoi TaxID=47466 RepID=A0AAX3JQ16_9SPIR|nr:hypothetical protein [Borrelia miyamotoi]WAZ72804.1 hypothetical protein O5404_07235 [Borrelia miyamotoi]
MILNASETAMKNIFSDNQHSEIHLSKINSTNKKDISPKQPESQKDILVSASSMPKKEEFSSTKPQRYYYYNCLYKPKQKLF